MSLKTQKNVRLTDSVQYILRPKDIAKASDLFGVDAAVLERLNAQKLLNATYIRGLLMRADYERLTSGLHWLEQNNTKYMYPEVMRAIQREYNVSKDTLLGVLKGKNSSMHFCSNCGARVAASVAERTGGLCSICYADNMDIGIEFMTKKEND